MSGSGNAVVPFRYGHDGWTPLRQGAFLCTLRETASVRDACNAVGLSSTSAYRAKQRLPEFGAAWDAALAHCLPALERAAYLGAVEGWLEPILYKGEVVAHRRRYSDAMLRLLLQREDKRPVPKMVGGKTEARARAEAELVRRLDAMARRLNHTPDHAGDRGAAERGGAAGDCRGLT